ncbi:LacI family DNA-binding transcriptional regulator [Bifidobacterium avesanii]|uniref:LacI family DNA-binding transcriptional regulator n=1 Tax=Bifidobacterium avesanii TaxID=1798157 RepID=A0A7K3TG79_9BIFI|nr:LacI family DNA-binding transcriptional regulator [Bifidobacterium avesanii]NEG78105.1 LacI family DNA-binding transcriptional regulator [Bifidobacterium avesanii]
MNAASNAAPDAPGNGRAPTIRDVARVAGVSASAVSKVLRDAYGVSDDMRAKVTFAAQMLGYRPKTAARALRGRSYSIGVLTPGLGPFPTQIAEEINRHFAGSSYRTIIAIYGGDEHDETEGLESMLDRNVDGVILITPHIAVERLERFAASLPMVLVSRNGRGAHFDSVTDDGFAGAEAMVGHLAGLGHRRIAYISQSDQGLEPPYVLSSASREEGYAHAMADRGLAPWVVRASYSEDGGYGAACALLDADEPPTAIFAGADVAAFGVMRAAYERHVAVPAELSVAGYDNVFASGLHGVDLTTVDQASVGMGDIAARLLAERLDGRTEPKYEVVAPKLVVRGTSVPPRVE